VSLLCDCWHHHQQQQQQQWLAGWLVCDVGGRVRRTASTVTSHGALSHRHTRQRSVPTRPANYVGHLSLPAPRIFTPSQHSAPLNSTHYAMLCPQNGDRIVAVDFVTSFHALCDCKKSQKRRTAYSAEGHWRPKADAKGAIKREISALNGENSASASSKFLAEPPAPAAPARRRPSAAVLPFLE